MSDRIFEQVRDEMIELEQKAEAEAQVKEDMEKAIDSRIESLTEEATLETLANITKTLCDELVAEGFEREAVVAYLTTQTSSLEEERQAVILKAMEVDEQILGHTVKNDDSEEVKIKKLTEEASQIVMDKMQVMKDEGKSAAEIMEAMQDFLEAKLEEKDEEEAPAEEKPAKLDVSKDVKGLMDTAKSALDTGDYEEAANAISKLATIKEIVPDEALPDFPEDESEPEEVEADNTGVGKPAVDIDDEEPIESVEPEVKDDDAIEEEVVDEEIVEEGAEYLKNLTDSKLEALQTRLARFDKDFMKSTMEKVNAEIKRREGADKKD